jgi:hypothetical protein
MGINKSVPGIKNSEQTVLNTSFDEDFGVLAVEGLVYNPTTCTIDRMVQPGQTLPTSGTNPSLVLTYTGSNLTTIQKVISGVTYSKSLTYDGSGNLTGVSVWS